MIFANPLILLALISLPVIWWLLRITPPRPQQEVFPPTRILARLQDQEETPAQSPWWLTLLRLLMAAAAILAMAAPIINPNQSQLAGDGSVTLIIDDGWTSAHIWDEQKATANQLISEASDAGRIVRLISTTQRAEWRGEPLPAQEAAKLLEPANPRAIEPDHKAVQSLIAQLNEPSSSTEYIFLSDGLAHEGTQEMLSTALTNQQELTLISGNLDGIAAIENVRNLPANMSGTIAKLQGSALSDVTLIAKDKQGLVVATTKANFSSNGKALFEFEEPVELRNQFARLEIREIKNAASVQLLDENNRRRLVGLISGENFYQAQPLLSPLYYISNALDPFTDLRRPKAKTTQQAVEDLLNQGVDALVLSDIGNIEEATEARLLNWVTKGGVLIRFAGPRLGASENRTLLPVEIKPGDRQLGGALSWDTPKKLAPFEPNSPFFGLQVPEDVLIEKQLLALQDGELENKAWARLEDGTPLVTAQAEGFGHIILYHVSSDNEWSNLPLSSAFVEMLRRTINIANSGSASNSATETTEVPPYRLLDGHGKMIEPDGTSKPLSLVKGETPKPSAQVPPGYYGTQDGYIALNLVEEDIQLASIDSAGLPSEVTRSSYETGEQIELSIWFLVVAACLFIVDCLAVLWMSGAFANRWKKPASAIIIMVIITPLAFTIAIVDSHAQQAEVDYASALKTRLAFVKTGVSEVDEIAMAGLRGLTQFLKTRTALEPGEPIGLDVESDELAFYSLIYWPIDDRADMPSVEAMARVEAFMKNGGSIIFDTRDEVVGVLGGTSSSPAARYLQRLLASIDIPALEPVPDNHVLTKSFYLLDNFPGRYVTGDLWVEASRHSAADQGQVVSKGDGVSSIMITSNDFVGAWAIDANLQYLLPTVPNDPLQRNYAFRAGVNLMMYALTGNYKSDQVHLPAIIERLGQ